MFYTVKGIFFRSCTTKCQIYVFTRYTVIFRNKRSQAKGVYYVFLYKQHMDNVYTQVALHRFPLGSLVVG